jgi:flagellar basal body-associated protein FliL
MLLAPSSRNKLKEITMGASIGSILIILILMILIIAGVIVFMVMNSGKKK